jgi:hypothetical protein
MFGEFEKGWGGPVVDYFSVLPWHSLGGTEERHVEPQSGSLQDSKRRHPE